MDADSTASSGERRELLMQHPTTRPYSLDSGFLASIDKVASLDSMKDQQAMASIVMSDQRLTMAMAALQGWGLTVTEKEAKKAESVGDMPKRDAIQMPHYEYAHVHDAAGGEGRGQRRL